MPTLGTSFRRSATAAGAAIRAGPQASRWRPTRLEFHSGSARRQPAEQSATMKIQLLLRRVDPLGVGSDDPAAERAHEPTVAVVDGALDAVARSTAATAGPVLHRSSSTAATTAAA